MKHKVLSFLKSQGFNVPDFIVVSSADDPRINSFVQRGKKYAVRSSFDVEDGKNDSYAGQFKTILNVSPASVQSAIVDVLQSANNTLKNGYKGTINTIPYIIIQEMVDPDLSGVVFTANPLGILNEMVIVAGKGLGAKVVDDKTNTVTYYYNYNDQLIDIVDNTNGLVRVDKSPLFNLIRIAKEIKKTLKYECDIEFAIKDYDVFILQARPITTLNKEYATLDNSNIVESYPDVSLPLTQDYVKAIYYGIFHSLIERLTGSEKFAKYFDQYAKDMVTAHNWHMYYIINNWYRVLKLLPFSKAIIKNWQKMLGVENEEIPKLETRVPFWIKTKVICSFIHFLIKIPKLMDALNESFDSHYQRFLSELKMTNTINELLKLYDNIRDTVLSFWDLTLINDMYAFIYTGLSKDKQYISQIKNLESMKPVLAMNDLISVAQAHGTDSDLYQKYAHKYIDLYGDRCVGELKLETQTYRTNPELLAQYVMSAQKIEKNPIQQEKQSFCTKRAQIGIKNREISRMNRSRLFGISRAIFLKIGQSMEENGQIDTFRDVFYLNISEINETDKYQDIIKERKSQEILYKQTPSHTRVVFDKEPFDRILLSSDEMDFDANDLYGTPTSDGDITAEVVVVTNPSHVKDVKGKIIVTHSTDPGWVFLIKNCAGIIAEKGSLLSHTAIISRELKIPAIVNVKHCTKVLKTGDIVTLNTKTGIITKLERK